MDRYKMIQLIGLWLLVALLLSSCQKESGEIDVAMSEATIYLGTSVKVSQNNKTRTISGDYTAYSEGINKPGIIKLFFTPTEGKIITPFFNWQDGCEWKGSALVDADKTYNIYGYMPQEAATATISSEDYSTGATLTLSGLSTASAQDVCVVVGVAKETAAENFNITSSTVDVKPGQFSYTVNSGDNYMYVLMEHIYAEVALNFAVDKEYAKLRTIKLRKVVMTTMKGITKATVSNVPMVGSNYSSISFDAIDGVQEADIELMKVSEDEKVQVAVYPSFTQIPAFFTPLKSGEPRTLVLTSFYDVYDRYGHLIRENCQAKNTWTLNKTLESGQQIVVNVIIRPTYLYQLGSYDQDNPTIEVEI